MPLLKPGQPIRTTGNNLVGLWRPSFVKVGHRLFVYGGGGTVTNDLHVLNLCDMRWDTIQVWYSFLSPCQSPCCSRDTYHNQNLPPPPFIHYAVEPTFIFDRHVDCERRTTLQTLRTYGNIVEQLYHCIW